MHLNIQSLRTKLDLIQIELQHYYVLILSETWLSPDISNNNLKLTNFNPPFRSDRVGRSGGGVTIYVHDGITAIERPDLSVNGVEAIWVDIKPNRKTLLVGGFYSPTCLFYTQEFKKAEGSQLSQIQKSWRWKLILWRPKLDIRE